jgi:hypothetical protein
MCASGDGNLFSGCPTMSKVDGLSLLVRATSGVVVTHGHEPDVTAIFFNPMNVDPVSIRRPRPGYEGRNHFAKGPTEPEEINDSNLYEALDNHRRALYVINHKKCSVPTYVPSVLYPKF